MPRTPGPSLPRLLGERLTSAPMPFLVPLVAWSLAWKGLALWRAARERQWAWFAALLVVNTGGALEIVYLARFAPRPRAQEPRRAAPPQRPRMPVVSGASRPGSTSPRGEETTAMPNITRKDLKKLAAQLIVEAYTDHGVGGLDSLTRDFPRIAQALSDLVAAADALAPRRATGEEEEDDD